MTPERRIARIKKRLELTQREHAEFLPLVPPAVTHPPWLLLCDSELYPEPEHAKRYYRRIAALETYWHAELVWLCNEAAKMHVRVLGKDGFWRKVHDASESMRIVLEWKVK